MNDGWRRSTPSVVAVVAAAAVGEQDALRSLTTVVAWT